MKFLCLIICIFVVACSGNEKKETETPITEKSGEITIVSGERSNKDNVSPFISYTVTGEYIVRYSPDGEETPLTKEIGAHVVVRNNPYESIHKSLMMKRLSKEFIIKCSACHDDYGNGVIGPSLLDKSGDQVYDMIIKYRTDKEENVLMKVLVSKMTNDEIRFIADDIAAFNEEIRKEKVK